MDAFSPKHLCSISILLQDVFYLLLEEIIKYGKPHFKNTHEASHSASPPPYLSYAEWR